MKTMMTVLLAVINVTFGVRIGSVEKVENAASFYLDSIYSVEEYVENVR